MARVILHGNNSNIVLYVTKHNNNKTQQFVIGAVLVVGGLSVHRAGNSELPTPAVVK